jgi:hypothetical protein
MGAQALQCFTRQDRTHGVKYEQAVKRSRTAPSRHLVLLMPLSLLLLHHANSSVHTHMQPPRGKPPMQPHPHGQGQKSLSVASSGSIHRGHSTSSCNQQQRARCMSSTATAVRDCKSPCTLCEAMQLLHRCLVLLCDRNTTLSRLISLAVGPAAPFMPAGGLSPTQEACTLLCAC